MIQHGILQELVLVYALAVTLLLLSARLRVPAIVMLIGAGVIAGPAGIGLVTTQSDVDLLAEIGVALLLFTAGLEFSMAELRRVWRTVIPAGLAQVALTTALTAALILGALHGTVGRAALLGLFVALSSTAVVFKELARRNHLHAPHGGLAAGVLLLQDLVVIAVLATTPTLLGGTTGSGGVGRALLTLVIGGGGILLIGRVLLPWLLRAAASISREAFALSVLLASVGTAWIAALLGLSMAAGAFVAGLVLAEGEFSHQVHADIRPLRDLLSSLFFISIGMLVDVRNIVPILPAIVGLAVLIVLIKAITAIGALLIARASLRVAIAGAIVLAQVGEFSFVLGRAGVESGMISVDWWQMLLGASVLTMAATPFLVGVAPAVAATLARRSRVPIESEIAELALSNHVVILGYGVGGQLLARSLGELFIPYIVLELNGTTVRRARAAGVTIYYADATAEEPLHAAGVTRAAAVIAVLSDPDASARAVRAVRSLAPQVPIIARTRFRGEAENLMRMGATLAVAEELEASLEVLSQLLARLFMPGNVAEAIVDNYRRTVSAPHAQPRRAPALPMEELPRELRSAPVSIYRLDPSAWGGDRTLHEINLRAITGATVLAVRRNGRTTTSPSADFRLQAGDDVFLLGDESDILLARAYLAEGPHA